MANPPGFGTIWQITVSASLTSVTGLEDIEFPNAELVLDEVTNHGSTGGAAEFAYTGMQSGTKFKATLIWDDTSSTHGELVTLSGSGATNAMTIADSASNETLAFSGIVESIKRITAPDKMMRAEVTVQVTGAISIS